MADFGRAWAWVALAAWIATAVGAAGAAGLTAPLLLGDSASKSLDER